MKKKLIIIMITVIVTITIFMFLILGNHFKTNSNESLYSTDNNSNYNYLEENEVTDYVEEETIKLSESCEIVLATGSDKSGNFYELVANQKETYDSVKIEIGVIKNNEWLLEPTTDMPFISKKTGLIHLSSYINGVGLDDIQVNSNESDHIYGDFKYVCDGCFYGDIRSETSDENTAFGIVYNVENQKTYYNTYDDNKYDSSYIYTKFYKDAAYGKYLVIQKDYKSPYKSNVKKDILILNTDTMETKVVIDQTTDHVMGPVGDGLFAVGIDYYDGIKYFYDTTGNLVIDLTSYDSSGVHSILKHYFVDGRFTFNNKNSAGTNFQVTIDTSGNVIDSIKS